MIQQPELLGAAAVVDPTVIDAEVFRLTVDAQSVANTIADQPVFNHLCADMILRNVAGMFNGGAKIDADTYDRLPEADRGALRELAHSSYDFMFEDGGRREIAEHLALTRPASSSQAMVDILSHAFNATQLAASIGPGSAGGYPHEKEGRLRELVRDYGRVFAGTYRALNGIGHPLATDPANRSYFTSNTNAARPHESVQDNPPSGDRAGTADLTDWA